MPTTYALAADYSYARPGGATLAAAGIKLVGRYLGDDGRCITPAERDDLYAHWLRLFVFYETSITRPRGGYNAGVADALAADRYADALDWPRNRPIFYVVDVGNGFPYTADYPAIVDYFRGIADTTVRSAIGCYGPYPVIEMLKGKPKIRCFMETAGGSGSGNGTGGSIFNNGDRSYRRLSDVVCLYQEYGGVIVPDTDNDQVLHPDTRWQEFSYHPFDSIVVAQEDLTEMHQILWTKPDSRWAQEVVGLPAGAEYSFRLVGGFFKHLENEPQRNAVRMSIVAEGGSLDPNGDPAKLREHHGVPDDFFYGLGHFVPGHKLT